MTTVLRNKIIRVLAIGLSLLVVAYLIPIFDGFTGLKLDKFINDVDGLNLAWSRSIGFSLLSTLTNILLGLFLAIRLRHIGLFSLQGKYLAFLLVPVILGNVSIAFIGKLLFAGNPLFHHDATIKFAALTMMQFWQFGTLYTYLFWLVIQGISPATLSYAHSVHMSAGEQTKDILLPACRNLAVLLFMLNFIFCLYEEAKIQFIFKSSRGTDTELISQWLNRNYQSVSLFSLESAVQSTLQVSIIVLVIALCTIVLAAMLFNFLYKSHLRSRNTFTISSKNAYTWAKVYWWSLLVFVVSPIVFIVLHTAANLRMDFQHLALPMAFTALAALGATLCAAFLGVLWRIGWKQTMSSFNNRSIAVFVALFTLLLIPPINLFITGFQWFRLVGYDGKWSLYAVWIYSHIILTLPLLSSFITVTHFRTTNTELDYLDAQRLTFWEIVRDAFARRFAVDYILSFLIAYSLIWNEAIVNNILSDFIPSFVSELKMSIIGRSTDYAKGMSYLLVSLLIALVSLGVWKKILDRISDNYEVVKV